MQEALRLQVQSSCALHCCGLEFSYFRIAWFPQWLVSEVSLDMEKLKQYYNLLYLDLQINFCHACALPLSLLLFFPLYSCHDHLLRIRTFFYGPTRNNLKRTSKIPILSSEFPICPLQIFFLSDQDQISILCLKVCFWTFLEEFHLHHPPHIFLMFI